MAQKYYSFGKFNDQQTKTFVVGDLMDGTKIVSFPTTDLLAGVPIAISSAGAVSASEDVSGITGKFGYLLAEDFPASGAKMVCYEIVSRDIDSLVEKPKPRKVLDLNGDPLYI